MAERPDPSQNGWTPVPRDTDKLIQKYRTTATREAPYVPLKDIQIPSTEIAVKALEHVRSELTPQTLNHSIRAYFYGVAIAKTQFPDWKIEPEAYYLTALFHDIGTTKTNLNKTRLSFEFYGGMLAHSFITDHSTSLAFTDLAEAITEAIVRHQDFSPHGEITALGQLIQLATKLDNMGALPELIHPKTMEEILQKYPRNGWTGCFVSVVKDEIALKPWCHTTSMGPSHEDIIKGIEAYPVLKKFD